MHYQNDNYYYNYQYTVGVYEPELSAGCKERVERADMVGLHQDNPKFLNSSEISKIKSKNWLSKTTWNT